MEKIERGDGFPCIECSKWCTKEENYKCTRCKLDNVRQAKSLLRQSTNAPAGGKRWGLDYEEFSKILIQK